jgi:hypothetical protein
MKVDTSALGTLNDTHKILTRRVRKYRFFYPLFIVIGSLLILIIGSYMLFRSREGITREEYLIILNVIMFYIVMFDILVIHNRLNSFTLIEPIHIRLFPISEIMVRRLYYLLLLFDLRIVLYISAITCFGIYFLQDLQVMNFAVSIIFIMTFYLFITGFFLACYFIFHNYFSRYRDTMMIFFHITVLLYTLSIIFDYFYLLAWIPVINILSYAIYYLIIDKFGTSILYFGIIGVGLLATLLLSKVIVLRRLKVRV